MCVRVHIYICIHTNIHIFLCVCTCICMHTRTKTHAHTRTHTHTHINIRAMCSIAAFCIHMLICRLRLHPTFSVNVLMPDMMCRMKNMRLSADPDIDKPSAFLFLRCVFFPKKKKYIYSVKIYFWCKSTRDAIVCVCVRGCVCARLDV